MTRFVFGRAASRLVLRKGPACALLCIFSSILFPDCREKTPVAGEPGPIRFEFALAPATRFTYTNWQLDSFGSRIPGSEFRNSWTVADTGIHHEGFNSILIIDSTFGVAPSDTLQTVDSLYLCQDVPGDVYWFGFVSAIAQQRDSISIEPTWNRIAAFSLGTETPWLVGRKDTTSGGEFRGRILSGQEYVTAKVNGVQTLLTCYRVTVLSDGYFLGALFSDSPVSIPLLRTSATSTINGRRQELVSVVTP
jgi:hypothetical protein